MAVYGPVRHQRNITWTSEASVHIILFWWRSVPYTAIWPSVPWIICYIWPSKLLHAFVLKSVLQQLLNYQQSEQLPLSSRYRTCKTSMTHAIEIPALACERHTNLERLNWFMEFNNPPRDNCISNSNIYLNNQYKACTDLLLLKTVIYNHLMNYNINTDSTMNARSNLITS